MILYWRFPWLLLCIDLAYSTHGSETNIAPMIRKLVVPGDLSSIFWQSSATPWCICLFKRLNLCYSWSEVIPERSVPCKYRLGPVWITYELWTPFKNNKIRLKTRDPSLSWLGNDTHKITAVTIMLARGLWSCCAPSTIKSMQGKGINVLLFQKPSIGTWTCVQNFVKVGKFSAIRRFLWCVQYTSLIYVGQCPLFEVVLYSMCMLVHFKRAFI